jgi:putative flippase GtrA
MIRRSGLLHFMTYAAIGATGTAVQYVILFIAVTSGGAAPATASSVGAVLGALVNYWLNCRITFRTSRDHTVQLPKFAATAFAGIVVTWIVMSTLTRHEHIHFMIAQCIATAASLLLTYVVNSCWTFRARRQTNSA